MYEENDFGNQNVGDSSNDLDNDEISAEEEAFMKGYDEDLDNTSEKAVGDQAYDDAFEKKSRRSKRNKESFDEEEMESEVLMQ